MSGCRVGPASLVLLLPLLITGTAASPQQHQLTHSQEAGDGGASPPPPSLPGPPVNTTAHTITPTSILVRWSPPLHTNGDILAYRVTWVGSGWGLGHAEVEGNTTSYVLANLMHCSEYVFNVSARNEAGYGLVPGRANATTDPIVPDPGNLTVTFISPFAVIINWDYDIAECQVEWNIISYEGQVLWDNDTDTGQQILEPYTQSTVLTFLVPWTNYTVCLRVQLVVGAVGEPVCAQFTTDATNPGQPASFRVAGSDSRHISLAWTPPDQINGQLHGYLLTWADHKRNLSYRDQSIRLTGLRSYKDYFFHLQAVNKINHDGQEELLIGDFVFVHATTGNVNTPYYILCGGVLGVGMICGALTAIIQNRRKLATERRG